MSEAEIDALADRVAEKVMAKLEHYLIELTESVNSLLDLVDNVLDEDGVDAAWEPPTPKKERIYD